MPDVRSGHLHEPASAFSRAVARSVARGELTVQPRMGFSDPLTMRLGLQAVHAARAATVGTITVDSYTRTGQYESARQAVANRAQLNGYPIVTHTRQTTLGVIRGILDEDFPIQVRHGAAAPQDIFRAMRRAGLDATEGGPVSYCLPYGTTPLAQAVKNWSESSRWLAETDGRTVHIETFGGCMMGQLCPPGMLVAISILEGLFFRQHGVRSPGRLQSRVIERCSWICAGCR